MFEHVRTHTSIHLTFLARSRVLLGFGALIVLGSSIGLVPALFFDTTANRFEVLKQVAHELHGTASLITSGLGLLALWSHRRQRTIKMVLTKPSPLEGWVASIFASAAMAGIAAHVIVAAATFGLSRYWGVPYEAGFLYLAVDRFVESMIALAFLTALGAAFHPVIATLVLLFFNESTFKFLGTIVAGASQAGQQSPFVRMSDRVLSVLYYLAPTFEPFNHKTQLVEYSLRVTGTDWKYVLAGAGYALLACAVGYMTTIVVLRRRPLV